MIKHHLRNIKKKQSTGGRRRFFPAKNGFKNPKNAKKGNSFGWQSNWYKIVGDLVVILLFQKIGQNGRPGGRETPPEH